MKCTTKIVITAYKVQYVDLREEKPRTPKEDIYTIDKDRADVDFVQSMVNATKKFRKMGREDAHAGELYSSDEICRRLEARFTHLDPLVAHAVARVLSNCYTEGVKEVQHETNKLYS